MIEMDKQGAFYTTLLSLEGDSFKNEIALEIIVLS